MPSPAPDAAPDPNPEQTALLLSRVRRMMLIAALTTGLGIAAIVAVIGYRLFRAEGSAPQADTVAMLPKGARIVATAVAGDRLLITVEAGGRTEIHSFDPRTLKPAGTLRFAAEP